MDYSQYFHRNSDFTANSNDVNEFKFFETSNPDYACNIFDDLTRIFFSEILSRIEQSKNCNAFLLLYFVPDLIYKNLCTWHCKNTSNIFMIIVARLHDA